MFLIIRSDSNINWQLLPKLLQKSDGKMESTKQKECTIDVEEIYNHCIINHWFSD